MFNAVEMAEEHSDTRGLQKKIMVASAPRKFDVSVNASCALEDHLMEYHGQRLTPARTIHTGQGWTTSHAHTVANRHLILHDRQMGAG